MFPSSLPRGLISGLKVENMTKSIYILLVSGKKTKVLLNVEVPLSHFMLQLLNEKKQHSTRNAHNVSINLLA